MSSLMPLSEVLPLFYSSHAFSVTFVHTPSSVTLFNVSSSPILSVLLLYTLPYTRLYYLCVQICSYNSEFSPTCQIYLTEHLHFDVPLKLSNGKTEHINFTAKPEPTPSLPYLGKKENHPRKIF